MQIIGEFREMFEHRDDNHPPWSGRNIDELPSFHDIKFKLPEDVAGMVATYMESDEFLSMDVMCYAYDIFTNETIRPSGGAPCGDGEWLWINELSYYVRKYRIDLPKEFIRKATQSPDTLKGIRTRVKTDELLQKKIMCAMGWR